jgi:hypothetical protein
MKPECTSRPDCPCDFCVHLRTEPSEKDKQDQLAEEFFRSYSERRK